MREGLRNYSVIINASIHVFVPSTVHHPQLEALHQTAPVMGGRRGLRSWTYHGCMTPAAPERRQRVHWRSGNSTSKDRAAGQERLWVDALCPGSADDEAGWAAHAAVHHPPSRRLMQADSATASDMSSLLASLSMAAIVRLKASWVQVTPPTVDVDALQVDRCGQACMVFLP